MISASACLSAARSPVDDDGFAAVFTFQLCGFGGLMFARLLIGLFEAILDGKRLLIEVAFAREETHLVDATGRRA